MLGRGVVRHPESEAFSMAPEALDPDRPPRVLFVLLWRASPYDYGWGKQVPIGTPGSKPLSHGLLNSATFMLQMLLDAGVDAGLVHVGSDNDIWREVLLWKPTHVILEGFFIRPKKLDDLAPLFPDVRFIVRGHSSTPFLAQDLPGFPWALDYLTKPNGILAPNDADFLREMRFLAREVHGWDDETLADRVPFLPNYYPVGDIPPAGPPHVWDGGQIDVGCFGAVRPFKNMVGQGIAALMFAKSIGVPLRFHINGDRAEAGGGPSVVALETIFAAVPGAELIRHAWRSQHEFLELVREMDLVTQVSFSETFCIVAADAASQGVPLVASSEIPWVAWGNQAFPTDTADIAATMERVWLARDPVPNWTGLRDFSARSRELWLAYFGVDD